MPFTLYFIRHGQTDWNAEGRIQGQLDTQLNDKGRGQAKRNGDLLAEILSTPENFDFIASPLLRTFETMQIVRGQLGMERDGFPTDDRLKEIHFGIFQGMTYKNSAIEMPEEAQHREADKWLNAPPEGESYFDLTVRIKEWFLELKRDTICVSHGGVGRALRGLILDLPKHELVELDVPQDKVLKIRDGHIEWL